jgi:hypothetical protein
MSDLGSSGRQLNKVFLFAAASDILTGLVLAAIGLSMEEEVLTIIGVALAIGGTAVLAWLIVRTSRPEQL